MISSLLAQVTLYLIVSPCPLTHVLDIFLAFSKGRRVITYQNGFNVVCLFEDSFRFGEFVGLGSEASRA